MRKIKDVLRLRAAGYARRNFIVTHHVNILEMNGESYRLGQSKARQDKA